MSSSSTDASSSAFEVQVQAFDTAASVAAAASTGNGASSTNGAKPLSHHAATGVGFFDHMLDQFKSHAQIALHVQVTTTGSSNNNNEKKRNYHASGPQDQLMQQVGARLGAEFRRLLQASPAAAAATTTTASSTFACPLDEALVVAQLSLSPQSSEDGQLASYAIPPYGAYPATGRLFLGAMAVTPLRDFWQAVATHAGLTVYLTKLRGENAHHIVEATFKAFSRALRNLLDGVDTHSSSSTTAAAALDQLYGPGSSNAVASTALARTAEIARTTKETGIRVHLRMDGAVAGSQVQICDADTGEQHLTLLESFWTTVHQEAQVSLTMDCTGDLWIDEHHTAEDSAIALGQAWNHALGTKAGLNRMWSARVPYDAANANGSSGSVDLVDHVQVVVDLSNRPMLRHNLPLNNNNDNPDRPEHLGDVPVEMLEHVLESFVVNARLTVHIYVEPSSTESSPTLTAAWNALAVALGRALRYCLLVDQRRAGATASSKGTLSV